MEQEVAQISMSEVRRVPNRIKIVSQLVLVTYLCRYGKRGGSRVFDQLI